MAEGKTYIPRQLSEAVKDWEDETIDEINSRRKWDINEATLVLREELQREWIRRGRDMMSKIMTLRRSGIDSSRPVRVSRPNIAATQSRNAGSPSGGVKKELQKSQ